MNALPLLTLEQRDEAKAICDEVCEQLETEDEYSYDLNERRGKPGSFPDAVSDEAMRMLQAVGYVAERTGAVISVRKS